MFVDSEPETTAPETTAPDGIWSESVRRHALAAKVRPVPTSPDASPDDERLRILLVAPPWFPVPPTRYGGTEQVIGVLAEGLVRRGHDVTVLTTADSTTPGTIWATRDQSCPDLIGNWAIEIAHVVQAYRDDGDFDIIHDHTLTGAAVAACASHVPVVHTLHGQWTDDTTVVCRAISDHVNLVAISRDQAARAPDGVEIAATVHNGIDLDTFPYDADGGDHLGFLGRCGPDKSPELAIEAAHRLGRHMVMGIKVNEPDEWAWWYEQVEPLLDDHIEVIRNADHDQRLAILSGASAVLFPIQWPEPFGLVPVEANACGTPVVAFANGAAPEVVADGRSGIVVDPAAGVDGLVAAVPRAEALDRRECRDHVERSFSADRMVEDYLALYRRLVAAAGSRTPGRGVDHDSPLPKAG